MMTAKPSVAEKHASSVPSRLMKTCLALFAFALLSGCEKAVLLHPKGQVGIDERNLIFTTVLLMLIVVIPVLVLTLYFAWRYRASNPKKVGYAPRWADSHVIELVVWGIPLLIVITLGVITWESSHRLDPYRPLTADGTPSPNRIVIDAVALDWKWLFIYPEQGIATVNEIAFPQNVPVAFHITSNTVMNAFFIPALGGQIYAMAGMATNLHLIANEPGTFRGISSNFSGRGFPDMHFDAIATPDKQGFDNWVAKVKASGKTLDMTSFAAINKPSEDNPVSYYGSTAGDMFKKIINQYHYKNHDRLSRERMADMGTMSGAHE